MQTGRKENINKWVAILPLCRESQKDSRKEEDILEALWNFTSDYNKNSNSYGIVED